MSDLLSGHMSGFVLHILIFVVIADGYDRLHLSGLAFDHLFGFETLQKPLNSARGPPPFLRQILAPSADLPAIHGDGVATRIMLRRLPGSMGNKPEPRAEAIRILEERVREGLAVQGDETAHSGRSPRFCA
jgi:hypothetical protein